MKYAIISDLHANLEALEAVLADAQPYADAIICLGDIVGYNANPQECLHMVRDLCQVVIAGNHDMAASGLRPYEDFSDICASGYGLDARAIDPCGAAVFTRFATHGGFWRTMARGTRVTTRYR